MMNKKIPNREKDKTVKVPESTHYDLRRLSLHLRMTIAHIVKNMTDEKIKKEFGEKKS